MAWGLWREIVGLIAKVPESKDIAVYGRSDTTRGGGVMTRTRARFRWTTQVTRAARFVLDRPGCVHVRIGGRLRAKKDALFFLGCSHAQGPSHYPTTNQRAPPVSVPARLPLRSARPRFTPPPVVA